MRNLSIALTLLVALALSSCNSCSSEQSNTGESATITEEVVVVDPLEGTYEGVLPCADCPGIKATLTIEADRSYTLSEEYLEKDMLFSESGSAVLLEDNLVVLTADETSDQRFFRLTDEGALIMLTSDKAEPEAELVEHYTLTPKQ